MKSKYPLGCKVLIKDIVIPAGTVFMPSPRKTERFDDESYSGIIGLTDDSCGEFAYPVDGDDAELLKEYFVDLR